jgi:hypothetical protein
VRRVMDITLRQAGQIGPSFAPNLICISIVSSSSPNGSLRDARPWRLPCGVLSAILLTLRRETALLMHEVARLSKLKVDPLLSPMGCDTHKSRAGLPGGNGLSDLELPFP